METGIELIAEERKRQVELEGWTPEHDSKYKSNELAMAAATYVLPDLLYPLGQSAGQITGVFLTIKRIVFWPWEMRWWKPTPFDRIRELVKAGALMAAEIDRLQNNIP